jgi:hypothetical protein
MGAPGMNPNIAAQIQAAMQQGSGQIQNPAIAAQFTQAMGSVAAPAQAAGQAAAQAATQFRAAGQAAGGAVPPIQGVGGAATGAGNAAVSTGRSFATMATHIVQGMLVWQAMNTVMNAGMAAFNNTIEQTIALDSAAARLSVTLNVSKDSAQQYAQALAMAGVAYGMKPQESFALGQYAARVQPNPAQRQELTQVSAKLGAVTGEDPKKLMDDLNVTYRQTGIAVSRLGDMTEMAWEKSGTSASEYLNMMREVGPLAKSTGIDIEKMSSIAALAADRMGGSISDASNTWTRLVKAIQEPNTAQSDVMSKYGVKVGGDVQATLDQLSKIDIETQDLAALSGRPGSPEAANDMRTLFAILREYHGELQKGIGLNDAFAKSTNSSAFALQKLGAYFTAFPDMLQASIGGIKEINAVLQGMITLLEKGGGIKVNLPEQLGINIAGIGLGIKLPEQLGLGVKGIQQTEAAQNPELSAARAWEQRRTTAPTEPTAKPTPAQIASASMYNAVLSGENVPKGTIDISQYTAAQVRYAEQQSRQMAEDWLQALSDFYDSQNITGEDKEKAMAEAKKMVDTAVAFFEDNGKIVSVSGAAAKYLPDILQKEQSQVGKLSTSATDFSRYSDEDIKRGMALVPKYMAGLEAMWRQQLAQKGASPAEIARIVAEKIAEINQTQLPAMRGNQFAMMQGPAAALLPQILPGLSRTQMLEDRLRDLRTSLEELNDTEKKKAQLEGQWNIPTGAKIMVPLTAESQALIKEHGGETDDEANRRKRESILKEIAEVERQLEAEKAKDALLLQSANTVQGASNNASAGLTETSIAARAAAEALYAAKAAAGSWGYTQPMERQDAMAAAGSWPTPPAAQEPVRPQSNYDDYALRHPTPAPAPAPTSALGGEALAIVQSINIQPVILNMDSIKVGEAVYPTIERRLTESLRGLAIASGGYTQDR